MADKFEIKLPVFSGPLDLLLDLVEKRKLYITDVSLAEVTESFLSYVEHLQEFPLADSASFLVTASTLLLIKSRSLLPSLPLTEEEEQDIEELKGRLVLYKDIKDKSELVRSLFGKQIIFLGGLDKKVDPVFSPSNDLSANSLFSALKEALKNIPKLEKIPSAVVKKVISLEEAIKNLASRVQAGLKMSFSQVVKIKGGSPEEVAAAKGGVVVNFLAMLELIKRGVILATQHA
ncbi:MAG: segregation/condensation protein A, partial [Candidatus Paceibacterota bacterium]